MKPTFEDVTELAGTLVTKEQIFRLFNRYHWTSQYCDDKDVLEVACGVAPGVGYVARNCRSICAGDISEPILERARAYYKDRFEFTQFDAQDMPFQDNSFDVVMIHEALYYIPDAKAFVAEALRVLRPNGIILVSNSNKDLFDFNPSPHSHVYHGTVELRDLFASFGMTTRFFGSQPLQAVSTIQKMTRPLKRALVKSGLFPKSMRAKQFLKRMVFGKLIPMPAEITPALSRVEPLSNICSDTPCKTHKIIYCIAMSQPDQQGF